jgi:hypothetical protein
MSLFLLLFYVDCLVEIYIILYKNTPIEHKVVAINKTGVKAAFFTGVLGHFSAYLPILKPNPLINAINLYSPFGLGYGKRSLNQGMLLDLLEGGLGKEFDIKKCLDADRMVDTSRVLDYAKENKVILQQNLPLASQHLLKIAEAKAHVAGIPVTYKD